jgi:phospholipase C
MMENRSFDHYLGALNLPPENRIPTGSSRTRGAAATSSRPPGRRHSDTSHRRCGPRGNGNGLVPRATWRAYKLPSDLSMFALWPGFANGRDKNAGSLADFAGDCANDRLPSVSIVEPPYSIADDHPTHDPRRGQQFLGFVVNSLLRSPSWKSSALILTYDEHGGFFDHVAPPKSPEGGAEPVDLLGVRVPTLVVSPFTPRGVVSEVFEHTSILRTIAERWDLPLPAEAGPRMGLTKSVWASCFEFSRKRGRAPTGIQVPSTSADWRTQVAASGSGPVRSDMAESLAKATQVHAADELQDLLRRDR